MNYLNKLKAAIQQLEEQIELLSEQVIDAHLNDIPVNTSDLTDQIEHLKNRLISEQSSLIRHLSTRLKSESDRLDRMLGVEK